VPGVLIKVAFASGTDELNCRLVERMRQIFPELPLYVVSEFPPTGAHGVHWVPYHAARGFRENWQRTRAALGGHRIRLAGVMLVPDVPYRRMRLMALLMAPVAFLGINENLNDFMLRPRSLPAILRHLLWRVKNYGRFQLRPGGWVYGQARRLAHPGELRLPYWYWRARVAGWVRGRRRAPLPLELPEAAPAGISVVIPSRNGRELLAAQMPGILRELEGFTGEIVVSDNGSDDGTAEWLRRTYPQTVCEVSPSPLSFARAVNAGIRRARYSHILLLNNDMVLDPGFFPPLIRAFAQVPDLFCATAQIRFPAGVRREETGKTVLQQPELTDFPVRCIDPLPGEDLSPVLYGSGGCSLYDGARLHALGNVNEIYAPAYVEDLDLGWRGWQRGWPTVFAADAVVEHRHRATTSRYYTPGQLDAILEVNLLRFIAGAVADRGVFRRMWNQALSRLRLLASRGVGAAEQGLEFAARAALTRAPSPNGLADEELFAALCTGAVAVFPGRVPTGRPRLLVASPYLPYPLSHGGAVRMYNLMRRAAEDFDQVLVAFCDRLETPPQELLGICAEIVLVERHGSHSLPSTARPEVVEEFASPAFRAALRESVCKWQPGVAQLEFTQMAQYAGDCAPARTVLVEHDVTMDLYQQLLALGDDWELRRQLQRWRRFETAAWRQMDRVVAMSEKDRRIVTGAPATCLPNGVDLERFRPGGHMVEPRRLLFIGSFAHLPNLLALDFFLREVWPHLEGATLHVIAGSRHEYFLGRYRDRIALDLTQPGIEIEGFVPDVRPAYERAAVVVAPLVASAGTNIKILEAMAMAKAIVSTPAGVNGLDLAAGEEFVLAQSAAEMAAEISRLLDDEAARRNIESAARTAVERDYGWDVIARQQAAMYRELVNSPARLRGTIWHA
jgi:GT2 family glycosyltransferase/glycosyltransferase involved in cell wall biosynthesis